MSTLRKDMEKVPGFGPDTFIEVLDESEWGDYKMEYWEEYPLPWAGKVKDAPSGLLDQGFDGGFGAPERPSWTVWTSTHVGYGTEYDGRTGSTWVPSRPPWEA